MQERARQDAEARKAAEVGGAWLSAFLLVPPAWLSATHGTLAVAVVHITAGRLGTVDMMQWSTVTHFCPSPHFCCR